MPTLFSWRPQTGLPIRMMPDTVSHSDLDRLHAKAWVLAKYAKQQETFLDCRSAEILSDAYIHLRGTRGLPGKRVCGPEIRLICGGWYNFEHPEKSEYSAEDIAYALGKINRMNGHNLSKTNGYAVAQHCVLGSYVTRNHALAFEFLMHDAPEFVMGDMTTPLKQLCPDYQHYYHLTERDMARRFILPFPMTAEAKVIDVRMFATEVRDLMHVDQGTEEWEMLQGIEPYEFKITEWTPENAARAWLERFHELWPYHREQASIVSANSGNAA